MSAALVERADRAPHSAYGRHVDTTDLIGTIVQLSVPLVAGVLAWLLRSLGVFLQERSKENILLLYSDRLRAEVQDYIEDASTITTGELAPFRRPDSDGGERITDAELRTYARLISRRLLSEGAGQAWLSRLADVLGIPVASEAMEAKVARTVISEVRRQEDLRRPRFT